MGNIMPLNKQFRYHLPISESARVPGGLARGESLMSFFSVSDSKYFFFWKMVGIFSKTCICWQRGAEEKRPFLGEWMPEGGGKAGEHVVSHTFLSVQAEVPSKPVVRPYRPLTAQEVCYQRIQLAQQQAAQLAVAVQKASLSLPGEKKRIAHVPNAALSAAARQSKPAVLFLIAVLSSPL